MLQSELYAFLFQKAKFSNIDVYKRQAYCKQMGLEPYYLYRQKGMAGNMENVGYAAKGKAGVDVYKRQHHASGCTTSRW